MKFTIIILFIMLFTGLQQAGFAQASIENKRFDFYGDTIEIGLSSSAVVHFDSPLSERSVLSFYNTINSAHYHSITDTLLAYKNQHHLDDWLYYQLIRSTAELISPKAVNYQRYTLYKWFLLGKSGYATSISISDKKLLLYVQSDEEVFNIPYHLKDGKQYVCMNYHDYEEIDFDKEKFSSLNITIPEAQNPFSYKITRLPEFKPQSYTEKDLQFDYYQTEYHFKIMLNKQVKKIFNNYPVVDYETYFNIPLSRTTYSSLIPLLKENIKKMSEKDGVDYLMRFTRYAFAFESDTQNFGKEKRLSPEQTLLYDHSDCEDRAALFFYLTKEIYNLPMIVLSYPEHITIAVKFNKPLGHPIVYKGSNYWVCEPTPQHQDLRLGQSLPTLRKVPFEVVYAYNP